MIRSLFGPESVVRALRDSLDDQSVRHRSIADRVSGTLAPGGSFAQRLEETVGPDGVANPDIQDDMVALADTSLRYDAATRLLQRAYQGFRVAINGRG